MFNSAKTNCIACHKVGYVGGTAGPDLTRIGGVRSERDLLEAVLYPSASFVRSWTVSTHWRSKGLWRASSPTQTSNRSPSMNTASAVVVT